MNTRKIALDVLRDAEREDKYISLALDAALRALPEADERDKRLLANLVFGVTEKRVTLDWYIENLTGKRACDISTRLRFLLRLGLYQLAFLDRIPPHAAVFETVRLGKSPGERAFLNGVLRAYLRKKEEFPLPKDDVGRMSILYSFPIHIVKTFCENLGDAAEDALRALSTEPPTTLAVNTRRLSRAQALDRLRNAGINAKATEISPRGVRIFDGISYDKLCAVLGDGSFFVQDEASQMAILALAPKPGEVGVDCCACPGSKSFFAALCMEDAGKIYDFDLHASKLPLITNSAANLGLTCITAAAHDGRAPRADLVGACDFVICDVPCSGLGVLAKKPEIRFHADTLPQDAAATAREILTAASAYLRVGGRLLFSTCTLTHIENEDNYHAFLAENENFAPTDFTLGDLSSHGGKLTLLPTGERDGFFISLCTRIK